MKLLETKIIIQAPVAAVWQILLDFEKYPEWNPFIINIKGKAAVGSQLENTISIKGNAPQTFTPKVLVMKPQQEFRWLGKLYLKGVFDGEHYFKLLPLSDSKTKLIHGEQFTGILVKILMSMIGSATEKGFVQMNEALKKRVESTIQP